MKPRLISIFAGIGGFDLAAESAGIEVVAQVEKDAHCRKLLATKFERALYFPDVCRVSAKDLPECDILTGGWPCQDLSVAGTRVGLSGARSSLFYDFTRLTYELRPSIIVWENVPGLYSSDDGRDMCRVLMEFQRIGYHGAWRVFDAQYFGVAQRRRRVLGVFARGNFGAGRCAEILSIPEGMRWHPAPRRETREKVAGTLAVGFGAGSDSSGSSVLVAGTLGNNGKAAGSATAQDAESGLLIAGKISRKWSKGTGDPAGDECQNLIVGALSDGSRGYTADNAAAGHYIAFPGNLSGTQCAAQIDVAPTLQSENPTAIAKDGAFVRRLTPLECERLQGFPDHWTAGFKDSVRYRMLGNAVNVAKLKWIMRRLAAAL